jgi:hypothetical protein
VIRYIVVQHFHYDSTEPVAPPGSHMPGFEGPVPSFESRDEAEALARQQDSASSTGYVWPIEVDCG